MSTTTLAKTSLHRTSTASTPTTSYQACTWPGHCLGAVCATNDDCDNDWICVNTICSPCCDGSIETTTTSGGSTTSPMVSASASASASISAPSAAFTATTHKGFSKGAAIGIGLGIVAAIALVLGAALWIWHVRRRKHAIWEMPAPDTVRSRSDGRRSLADDQKRLFVNDSRGELPCPVKPAELSSVELVELEGDPGQKAKVSDEVRKPPLPAPEPGIPRQRYHFEEYEISPAAGTQGQWTLSPVSDPTHQQTCNASSHGPQPRHDAREDAIFFARDGQDSAYTLFRWPDTPSTSMSDRHR